MPEMDGLEVLRRIKQQDPSIEVVMITAYASLETVKLALSHGAFEYLIKPFSRQDLDDVVRRALLRRQTDLGQRSQVARLVGEMRSLSAKTRELEEAARREAAEQSLRVTQLSILREIARTIVGQLVPSEMAEAVTDQLRRALGYDAVAIIAEGEPALPSEHPRLSSPVRSATPRAALGHLVVDNRASGRAIDPRERELLEMLSEYLAIAVRNSRLYTEIATTKRSLEQLIASAGDAIIAVDRRRSDRGLESGGRAHLRLGPRPRPWGGPSPTSCPPAPTPNAKRRLAEGSQHAHLRGRHRPDRRGRVALAVTLSALRGGQGEFEGLIAIVHDITVQREVEGQLQQSEKLTALGQLAGGIAHDFNNLLQAILGYTQLMKQNLTDGELVTRSLKVLESAALDGSETVRRIQQFARLRPDEQFVALDVNQIVHDAVAIIRPRWDGEDGAREPSARPPAGPGHRALHEGPAGRAHRDDDQPGAQRHRRHAERRPADADHANRPAGLGGPHHRRHRHRHVGGRAPPHLRAVLLHQGRGRLRAWAGHGLLDRASATAARFASTASRARAPPSPSHCRRPARSRPQQTASRG